MYEIPATVDLNQYMIGERGGQANVYAYTLNINGTDTNVALKDGEAKWHNRRLLVLELCDLSLRGRIDALGADPIDKSFFMSCASGIAAGLRYLHEEAQVTIVHRDMKPENVLIDSNGVVKLCDFGISRNIDHTTRFSVGGLGTLPYMAPEQLRDEPCSNKIDIWSFGIIMWEMMTRRRPYEDMHQAQIIKAIGDKKGRVPMPSGGKMESLVLLLRKCWAQNPHERPLIDEVIRRLDDVKDEVEKMNDQEWREECARWQKRVDLDGFIQGETAASVLTTGQSQPQQNRQEPQNRQNTTQATTMTRSNGCAGRRALKSCHDTYLRAREAEKNVQVARGPTGHLENWTPGHLENWYIEDWKEQGVVLKARGGPTKPGQFLRAYPDGRVDLSFAHPKDEARSIWKSFKNGNGSWSFRSADGKWLSARQDGSVCTVRNCDGWEQFTVESW